MKTIDTLVEDIQQVLISGVPEGLDIDGICAEFGTRLSAMFKSRLEGYGKKQVKRLRLSAIGRSELQLWHEIKGGVEGEPLSASTLLKFLYGDVIEEILLTLSEVAGHKVTHRQETVEVDGVVRHIDAGIDDEVVDTKSASSRSFEKFKDGSLVNDDPFGYVYQIGSYATAKRKARGFLFAMDKTLGHITLLKIDQWPNIRERIAFLKDMLSRDVPPDYQCSTKKDKQGRTYLGAPCSYCPTKHACHKNMYMTQTSYGPRFMLNEVEPLGNSE